MKKTKILRDSDQYVVRVYSELERKIIAKYKVHTKKDKTPFSIKMRNILLSHMENEMLNKEIIDHELVIKEIMSRIMDSQIIPRVYGIVNASSDEMNTKIDLLNVKLNFIIDGLAGKGLVDGRPVIDDIDNRVIEKNWAVDKLIEIANTRQIKKNNK